MTSAAVVADLTFADVFVSGDPVAQGSMKAAGKDARGRTRIVHSNGYKLATWRDAIYVSILADYRTRFGAGARPRDQVVAVAIRCYHERPKSIASSVTWKRSAPDVDKLTRAVLDALTRSVIVDDSRVARLYVEKKYAPAGRVAGVHVVVSALEIPE